MTLDDVAAQTINQLGLTVLEARIYIALCRYDTSTVKTVSELTKTSQPDTYRVIDKLQNKGLVEKIIDKPARFRAVPFDIGISLLMKRKKAEYEDLQMKTKLLSRSFKEKRLLLSLEATQSHFAMVPMRETIVMKIQEAIEKSKETIDLFLTWKRFSIGIINVFAETCEKAWDRGVKFRMIIEKPEKSINTDQIFEFCRKSPFCSIRFLPGHPKTVLGVYDQREAFIIVNPKEGLFDSPALWSNNQSLITIVKEYFEMLWTTAKGNLD
jgi:sugar-specific transcriptional regulator TrmB